MLQARFGTAELHATFGGMINGIVTFELIIHISSIISDKKYVLVVSTYQMLVLLLFNTHKQLTFEVTYFNVYEKYGSLD